MEIDQKKAMAYVQEVMQKFEKARASLTDMERRTVIKYREAQSRAENLGQELRQLNAQIEQARARVRSLELQAVDAESKATSLIEFMVSMKFEDPAEAEKNIDKLPKPPAPVLPPAQNGKKAKKPLHDNATS